jgi:glycosyltransferase involved in cell wall biosynthesis
MRIAFLVSSLDGGGAERVAALLCNAWAARDHEVVLVPTFSGRGGCSYPLDPAVEVAYLADLTTTAFERSPVGRLLALRNSLRAMRPDVIVSFLTNVNVAAILAGSGVPVIVSERIYPPLMPLSRFWQAMRRLTYPRAARVVMQTAQGFKWLQREIPNARGAIIGNPLVMPLPHLPPVIDPAQVVPAEARLLLSVGRLDPQKNFALLIEAFAQVASEFPDWRLVILGEGDERAALEAIAASSAASERIVLPGRAGDVGMWYARADAFALTSRFEGFPNALLEALGHGVPSLTLDCPSGPADLMTSPSRGVLLPAAARPDEVADGLRALLAGSWPDIAREAAAIRALYDIGVIAEEWLSLFEQAIFARR